MLDPQLKRGSLDICAPAALRRGDPCGSRSIKALSGAICVDGPRRTRCRPDPQASPPRPDGPGGIFSRCPRKKSNKTMDISLRFVYTSIKHQKRL